MASEQSPLLVPPPPHTQNNDDDGIEAAAAHKTIAEWRVGDWFTGFVALGSLLVIVIFTWIMVFTQDVGELKYFAGHPPAMSLAVFLFTVGIFTLQPTRKPASKKAGLARHQIIQLGLAVPVLLVGAILMFVNKSVNGSSHFASWHGKFGLIAIIWIVLQIAAGGASVWFGGKALGGEDNAKAAWKWHRLSGYILFFWLLLTVHLAGGHADWVHGVTTNMQRIWIYTILPLFALIALYARARLDKLPGLTGI